MQASEVLEQVLRPVTAFLDEALRQTGRSRVLSRTALPLIRAIEAVPEAGRVAVFVGTSPNERPAFVAGPSFTAEEVEGLAALVERNTRSDAPEGPIVTELPASGSAPNRVRLFRLNVPGETPAALLVTVRDPLDDDATSVFDAFMDQVAQVAGLVVEDRRLRSRMTEQQGLLNAVVDAAPDAIIRIDRGGTILDFAGAAEGMFGWTRTDLIGGPVSRLMPAPHAARHTAYIEAFLKARERRLPGVGRRLLACHKDGHLFPVEIALSELEGPDDVEFIGMVRDISEREAREAEMDAMREALDAAALHSALGEFAATIAHELNQPLTAIANYMDALELRLAAPDEASLAIARALARKAAGQARLGAEIIRRTRRMTLKGETETRPDDFHGAVAEVLALVRKAAATRGVEVRHLVEGERTPAAFDRVQVQQVVTNLATNALRAMADSEERLLVVTTRETADSLQLVVRDTGPGIDEIDKARLFERFFRRSHNGMGLGLSIVRRIAHAHGGEISVDDAEGGGAQFTLTLPRRVL